MTPFASSSPHSSAYRSQLHEDALAFSERVTCISSVELCSHRGRGRQHSCPLYKSSPGGRPVRGMAPPCSTFAWFLNMPGPQHVSLTGWLLEQRGTVHVTSLSKFNKNNLEAHLDQFHSKVQRIEEDVVILMALPPRDDMRSSKLITSGVYPRGQQKLGPPDTLLAQLAQHVC